MQALLHNGHEDGLASLVHQLHKRMGELDLEVKQLTQVLAEQKCASASAAGSL
jgi:hypothetical protein